MGIKPQDNTQTNSIKFEYPPVRTQFLIFTLLGDYIANRGGKIWTSNLLHLMKLLGVSERAVRSALSRITQKGWLTSKKSGRQSQYILTNRGIALMESGQKRIFETPLMDWDGNWHLVVFSLSEEKRQVRHVLRTHLSWLGFGSLAPGTWISPHHPIERLEQTFIELEVKPYVETFSGIHFGPSSSKDLVNRCWDLDALADQYQDFHKEFAEKYKESREKLGRNQPLDREESFVRRFWLTHSFQSFPLKDPNLPIELLPENWIGTRARELFDSYHKLLGDSANQFVGNVLEENRKLPA